MKTEIINAQKTGSDTKTGNWFEIPVAETARAKKFYETIFDIEMHTHFPDDSKDEITFFPSGQECNQPVSGKDSGALLKSGSFKPSLTGVIAYLNANPFIQTVIDKIALAGGKVLVPKTKVFEGYLSLFIDTEGNRLALLSAA